jgi:hypothetical protein
MNLEALNLFIGGFIFTAACGGVLMLGMIFTSKD